MGAIIYTKRVNNQLVFSHTVHDKLKARKFLHISCLTEIHETCNHSPTPSPGSPNESTAQKACSAGGGPILPMVVFPSGWPP